MKLENIVQKTGVVNDARITPGMWLRRGFPVMIISLVVTSIIFIVFFDFFL